MQKPPCLPGLPTVPWLPKTKCISRKEKKGLGGQLTIAWPVTSSFFSKNQRAVIQRNTTGHCWNTAESLMHFHTDTHPVAGAVAPQQERAQWWSASQLLDKTATCIPWCLQIQVPAAGQPQPSCSCDLTCTPDRSYRHKPQPCVTPCVTPTSSAAKRCRTQAESTLPGAEQPRHSTNPPHGHSSHVGDAQECRRIIAWPRGEILPAASAQDSHQQLPIKAKKNALILHWDS